MPIYMSVHISTHMPTHFYTHAYTFGDIGVQYHGIRWVIDMCRDMRTDTYGDTEMHAGTWVQTRMQAHGYRHACRHTGTDMRTDAQTRHVRHVGSGT